MPSTTALYKPPFTSRLATASHTGMPSSWLLHAARCAVLTEDLSYGQSYGEVVATNPFA